ncbi:hypothetical protein G3142_005094 [Salmonella enterica subsp. enterica serovar Montevideo]|nr:hypothetical protein [Salmonella enterica subsp. enterica serovar Montevideo]EEK7813672.1 hypothetical protein [Salmonella enterica subsp. enterica serovar Montevideo]
MSSPYDKAIEVINEIIEKDTLGKELRAEGADGRFTWSKKDTRNASGWLKGYIRALEDNALVTDEQSQFLRKQIISLNADPCQE